MSDGAARTADGRLFSTPAERRQGMPGRQLELLWSRIMANYDRVCNAVTDCSFSPTKNIGVAPPM